MIIIFIIIFNYLYFQNVTLALEQLPKLAEITKDIANIQVERDKYFKLSDKVLEKYGDFVNSLDI